MILVAWQVQGIRDKLLNPQTRRHEFKANHGFRSFFETKCQKSRMHHNYLKILMDHSFGESENYHKPTEQELLDEYLIAVDRLTINDEFRLRKKVERLEIEKSQLEQLTADVARLKRKWRLK